MTLADMLGQNGDWPPASQAGVWDDVDLFRALLESDEVRLRQEQSVPWNQRYLVSPVPRMISRAKANLLYGETPAVTAGDDTDQANLDRVVGDQGLIAELHRAAVITSAEGEVWGRVTVDPAVCDVPIVEFVSRARVIPMFAGRFVQGATFITTWQTSSRERVRLLETYLAGRVEAALYRGTTNRLGSQIDLESFEQTRGRQPVTLTGIPWPLVAFMPNSVDSNPARGYSDYQGLRDRFLAINEAATIGQDNMNVAGRKRALVDAPYLRDGKLPAGDDLYIRHTRERGDIGGSGSPLQVIDYRFDADQTVRWIDHLIDSTLMLAGVSPQQVGRSVDGGSVSGTALRLKMSHSLLEAAGTGGYMDRGIERLLLACQLIDSRPIADGGFGRRWTDPTLPPTVTRQDGLPTDDNEAAARLTHLVAADAISLEERVRFLHPEWSDEQVQAETDRIRQDTMVPPVPEPHL